MVTTCKSEIYFSFSFEAVNTAMSVSVRDQSGSLSFWYSWERERNSHENSAWLQTLKYLLGQLMIAEFSKPFWNQSMENFGGTVSSSFLRIRSNDSVILLRTLGSNLKLEFMWVWTKIKNKALGFSNIRPLTFSFLLRKMGSVISNPKAY